MRKIFLISGKARHGKDTVADVMMEYLPNSEKIAVAYYLKDIAKRFFGWDGKKDEKGRWLLQRLGTDVIREVIDEDFHINRLCDDIKIIDNVRDYIFVPDVRFPNEIEVPKAEFGEKVVTIYVDRNIKQHKDMPTEAMNHISENALNGYKFDYYLDNSKDLKFLRCQIKDILKGEVFDKWIN